MAGGVWAGLCVLLVALSQVSCAIQMDLQGLGPDVLRPWREAAADRSSGRLIRVKRDWIIPPIRVSENSKQVPENLVQIKSDKADKVIYKLEGPGVDQDPKNLFEIDDSTGWIKSKHPLDREQYKSFKLKAYALSPSGERLENPSTIEIVVLDQNDNKPNFTQAEFVGYVPEFSIPGTPVTNVSATDADDPATENAALSFSIKGQESIPPFSINKTMFSINNGTGVIYTRDVGLDIKVVRTFRLTLQVADMSGEGLTSEGYAIIHVTDINNNAPRFTSDQYAMSAVENRDMYEIGTVNATDGDEPYTSNWRVKYTIAKGDPYGHFTVRTDPNTNEGRVLVVKPLDYETQREYQLILTVENEEPLSPKAPKGSPVSTTVTVTVVNENEAPRFKEDPILVDVPESVVPGTLLTKVSAYDPDNAKLRYEVTYDPENWLNIDPETGELRANKAFNPRSPNVKNNVYQAIVRVSDTDAGGISTTAILAITLYETNDFPPLLFPLRGTMCSNNDAYLTLVLRGLDEDLSPFAEPFIFALGDSHMAPNWTVDQFNDTHAFLYTRTEMEPGLYLIPVSVQDAGALTSVHTVNVTLCECDVTGDCLAITAPFLSNRAGLSFAALLVIIGSVVLLLLLLLLVVAVGNCRRHHIKKGGLLGGVSDDDIRDNVLNYDEQGGGEEDENAYNIEQLRNPNEVVPIPASFSTPPASYSTPPASFSTPPISYTTPPASALPRGKQPLRKDAPQNLPSPLYPRKPPADPTNIEDFINDGLEAADRDPNVPPYDTALIYDYEGEGSLAGSLSSIASGSSDGDQDYDYLNDWGPRFRKLANLYDPR